MSENRVKINMVLAKSVSRKAGNIDKTIRWNGINIDIKNMLTLIDTIRFVDDVMYACSKGDDGPFVPEMIDFAFRLHIVLAYSNVELPKDLEDQHYILYSTDLYDCICDNINHAQFESLKKTIDVLVSKIN